MAPVILLLATGFLSYLLTAVFVGCVSVVLGQRLGWPPPTARSAYVLVAVFAFLDLFWIPALLTADLTFTIGNQALADAFGFHPNTSVAALFDLGLFELLVWFVQAGVALATIQWAHRSRSLGPHVPGST